jgi:cytochrome c1
MAASWADCTYCHCQRYVRTATVSRLYVLPLSADYTYCHCQQTVRTANVSGMYVLPLSADCTYCHCQQTHNSAVDVRILPFAQHSDTCYCSCSDVSVCQSVSQFAVPYGGTGDNSAIQESYTRCQGRGRSVESLTVRCCTDSTFLGCQTPSSVMLLRWAVVIGKQKRFRFGWFGGQLVSWSVGLPTVVTAAIERQSDIGQVGREM